MGRVFPTLENVIVLTGLPVFGEERDIKLLVDSEENTLDGEGKRKIESLNKALTDSKVKAKSTYSS